MNLSLLANCPATAADAPSFTSISSNPCTNLGAAPFFFISIRTIDGDLATWSRILELCSLCVVTLHSSKLVGRAGSLWKTGGSAWRGSERDSRLDVEIWFQGDRYSPPTLRQAVVLTIPCPLNASTAYVPSERRETSERRSSQREEESHEILEVTVYGITVNAKETIVLSVKLVGNKLEMEWIICEKDWPQ